MAVVISGQAFVFADGGVTALGANIFNMGVVGALGIGLAMIAARYLLPRSRTAFLSVAAVGAWASVMLGALLCSVELGISGTVPFATVLPAMLGVHALIGVGEAIITVAAVAAVLATRPDLIDGAGFGPLDEPRTMPAAGVAS